MREAFTNIGEIGISSKGRDYLFRPSLYNVSKIAPPDRLPKELIELQKCNNFSLIIALSVLRSCLIGSPSCDSGANLLIGYITEHADKPGVLTHVKGEMEIEQIFIIALKLFASGMVGEPGARGSGGAASESFNAAEFSSAAVAHLGVPFEDAKHMTMIEFQKAINSKYPDENADKYPTREEHDAMIKAIKEAA